MQSLFPIYEHDQAYYQEQLARYLPPQMIDVHTHIWKQSFQKAGQIEVQRGVTWPSRVAAENSVEDLLWTYQALFPDKQVKPLVFGFPGRQYDTEKQNNYVRQAAQAHGLPALALIEPHWGASELHALLTAGKFHGCKVYFNYAPAYLPEDELRIYDFLPPHQLEVIDQLGLIVMLHIPRDKRLRDVVNIAQLLEIDRRYPHIKLIVAHVGRAYCVEDVGQALEQLADTQLLFDFSANTNSEVFYQLIQAVGSKRILFGSDLPITRMRSTRICEDGRYINVVPKGLYGDVSQDSHMREVDPVTEKDITFFLYEELSAMIQAGLKAGLSRVDFADIFYGNANDLLGGIAKC
ncbi:MAG: amidohydrolase family protein [Bacillota bacterium]|nr:amidohydrolase family protein [Bacillota bacterium]